MIVEIFLFLITLEHMKCKNETRQYGSKILSELHKILQLIFNVNKINASCIRKINKMFSK